MFGNSLFLASRRSLALTLSGEQENVDAYAQLGSPTEPVDVLVTLAAAAEIMGLSFAGLDSRSHLYLVWGTGAYLIGVGGNGGRGYVPFYSPGGGEPDEPAVPATAGGDGGDALVLVCPTTLNASVGYIWAGGGGGGGGGDSVYGGGGGGVHNGLGGNGGGRPISGTPGNDVTNPGPGAVPGTGGGNGGDGGDQGEAGGPGLGPNSQLGGAAGLAIQTNAYGLSFIGKDQSTLESENRIVGVVS